MAKTPYLGNKIILEKDVSLTATPEWRLVACITESDIDGSRETIDASTKCAPAQLAGQKTDTANFTGFFQLGTDPLTEISLNELAEAYDDGDSHHWRLIDEDGGSVYYREFYGPLTAYNESSNLNEPVTFTGTVAINGDIIRTLPVS